MKHAAISNQSQRSHASTGAVQSVMRALDILEVFLDHGPEIGLTEIARLLDLDKATTYRLLNTLENRGYVERANENRKYRLGLHAFELGAYYQNQLDVRKISLAYLREMVEKTDEDAFLCIREGDCALCIERVEGAGQVNIYSLRVGGKQPLHQGAAPRALLVGLDEEELTAYAHRSQLLQATPQTIRSLKELAADVECTRRQGYTISSNDATIGIAAVGAPIYDHHERVVASISLSGLAHRYEGERLARICQVIQDVSSRFSRQLGYVPTSTTH